MKWRYIIAGAVMTVGCLVAAAMLSTEHAQQVSCSGGMSFYDVRISKSGDTYLINESGDRYRVPVSQCTVRYDG